MKKYILNSPVLTGYGEYTYTQSNLDSAREFVASGAESAIGHASTAQVISTLLGVDVKQNRVRVSLQPGDQALVFQLSARPPEGRVLNSQEIEDIGYSWGLMTRTE